MKHLFIYASLIISTCTLAHAAAIFTSDFDTNDGGFSPLNQSTASSNGGELTFGSSSNQGGGVNINPATVLGINALDTTPLYFEFSAHVPAATSSQDELGFFFGAPVTQAQSSSIFNGGNTNGFTLYFNDLDLYAREGNNDVLLLSNLTVGQNVNFQIEWQAIGFGESVTLGTETVQGPQNNNNQFNSAAIINATTLDGVITTSGDQLIAGAVNQGQNQINDYEFAGIATGAISGTLTSFTVSNMPIPEPSSTALLVLAGSALLLRRKRN